MAMFSKKFYLYCSVILILNEIILIYSFDIQKPKSNFSSKLKGWLDNFLPNTENYEQDRKLQYPEQYPATYELKEDVYGYDDTKELKLIRTLLKQTQLESRPLKLIYDASTQGWNANSFHDNVDTKGACIVLCTSSNSKQLFGGYNPKGWASLGGARPSVASFLFYATKTATGNDKIQKLQKVGGGGLACARDDYHYGISFGADALVIPLLQNNDDDNDSCKVATSKLGPYFEKGPEDLDSLMQEGFRVKLESLRVYSGIYQDNEDIPYSGGVLDMTSG